LFLHGRQIIVYQAGPGPLPDAISQHTR
jgi:hypothetical protein